MRMIQSLAMIILTATTVALAKTPIDTHGNNFVVNRISPRVLVIHMDAPQSTNITAIQSRKGIVVIDTEVSPTFTAEIRERIQHEFQSDNFAYLINTHEHGDHTYGNQVFADTHIVGHDAVRSGVIRADQDRQKTLKQLATVVSTLQKRLATLPEKTPAHVAMKKRLAYYEAMRQGLGEGFQLTPPDITFADKMTLNMGDITLNLTWYGKSHSDSDIFIRCPEEGVLLTGDLFAPGIDPYVDSERIASMDRWSTTLEQALNQPESLQFIIPAHGDFLTLKDLKEKREFVLCQQKQFKGKTSAFFRFKDVVQSEGLEFGLKTLRTCFAQPDRFYVIHSEIDSYGFKMMMDGNVDDALRIFHVLADLFPENDIAFDSLGEAYLRKGDRAKAKEFFQRAVALNPDNGNAVRKLASLAQG